MGKIIYRLGQVIIGLGGFGGLLFWIVLSRELGDSGFFIFLGIFLSAIVLAIPMMAFGELLMDVRKIREYLIGKEVEPINTNEWKCSVCGTMNNNGLSVCRKCGGYKE